MEAATIIVAVTALLIPRANAILEYRGYNLTYCPEIPGERGYLSEVHQRINGDLQEYIGNVTMFKDFGNDNNFVIEAYRIIDDKEVRLLNYKGKHACAVMMAYGGEPYLRLARMANVENPEKCPVAKKDYFITDYFGVRVSELPSSLTSLAPKGKFRIKMILYDEATGNVDFCCQFYGDKY